MALAAKGIDYRHEPVDIFADAGVPQDYLAIHPFGKIPALRHRDFTLYETIAITRYIDEAFDGPSLQPAAPGQRARMTQIMCMADAYGYRPMVWDVYVERSSKPKRSEPPDEQRIAAAIPRVNTFLNSLNNAIAPGPWFLGTGPTLADFHVAPMFGYFLLTPEGLDLIAQFPRLEAWWKHVAASNLWISAVA